MDIANVNSAYVYITLKLSTHSRELTGHAPAKRIPIIEKTKFTGITYLEIRQF